MKTVLLTNKYSGRALELVQNELPEGFCISFLSEQTQNALENEIADADYLLAGGRLKITREVLANAGRLKMIQRSGVGLDSIDLDTLKSAQMPLYVNKGVNAESVAEHALLLMLACLRRLTEIDRNTKGGIWKKQAQGVQTYELHGKTVGLIGMGSIARTLVALLHPFGVKILYADVYRATTDFEEAYDLEYVPMEQMFARSDLISVHCPLTEKTRGLIDEKAIATMKNGVIIVNTARGEIMDTEAIAEGLRSGKVAYAGLDVHETEPIEENNPLLKVDNVILTPHIAGVTADSFSKMMRDAFRNIVAFDCGNLASIEQYRYI